MALVVKTTGLENYLQTEGQRPNRVQVLICGHPGTGKTRLAAQFPRPIIANSDDGLMSVADLGVPYVDVRSVGDMKALLTELGRQQGRGNRDYDTLVIDTIDGFTRFLGDDITRKMGLETMRDGGFDGWGRLADQLESLVTSLRRLDMNLVVLCHLGTSNDGAVLPAMPGKMKDKLPEMFDYVGVSQVRTRFNPNSKKPVRQYGISWSNVEGAEFL